MRILASALALAAFGVVMAYVIVGLGDSDPNNLASVTIETVAPVDRAYTSTHAEMVARHGIDY